MPGPYPNRAVGTLERTRRACAALRSTARRSSDLVIGCVDLNSRGHEAVASRLSDGGSLGRSGIRSAADSRLTAHGSRLTAHGSRLTIGVSPRPPVVSTFGSAQDHPGTAGVEAARTTSRPRRGRSGPTPPMRRDLRTRGRRRTRRTRAATYPGARAPSPPAGSWSGSSRPCRTACRATGGIRPRRGGRRAPAQMTRTRRSARLGRWN